MKTELLITRVSALLLIVCALWVSGCSKDSRVARLLNEADADFAAGNYEKAQIRYLNALRLQRTNVIALRKLGLIANERGIPREAFPYLNEARRLDPEDLTTRRTLGALYLATRDFAAARTEAAFVLQRNPTNEEALVLFVNTSMAATNVAEAKSMLERVRTNYPPTVGILVASAMLKQRERDTNAEPLLKQAVALDDKSALAHLAWGGWLWQQRRAGEADAELKKAADLAPLRSGRMLQYAEFKLVTGDKAAAKTILKEIVERAPDYLPGLVRSAQLAFAERDLDEAQRLIQQARRLDNLNPELFLLSTGVRAAKGDLDGALAEMERAASLYPKSPLLKNELGKLQLAKGDLAQATASLRQAATLDTNFFDPVVTLAQISIRRNEPARAIDDLNRVASLWRSNWTAHLLLASAYRASGDLNAAVATCLKATQLAPTNSEPLIQLGMTLRLQTNLVAARRAFEQALQLNPDALQPLQQIVAIEAKEKNLDAALQRVATEIARKPTSIPLRELAAEVHLAKQDFAKAEEEIQKALALDPDALGARMLLARISLLAGQKQQALDRYSAIVQKNTNNLAAWLQIALLQSAASNYTAAAQAYEKILTLNTNSFVVMNNLADLYSEQLGNLDRAEKLAQRARQLSPADPSVSDTLGWILYRKGSYSQALHLLTEGWARLKENPIVNFHIGMTHYMLGEEAAARLALQDALQLSNEFPGRDEAAERLSILSINPTNVTAVQRADLERRLEKSPGDPVLLSRIAYSYQQEGATAKAAGAFEKALARNPNSVAILVSLASLNAGPLNQPAKALEYARSARRIAPESAEAARTLGHLLLVAGDYKWARDLLEESSRTYSSDLDIWLELALAQFSLGQLSEASASLQSPLAGASKFGRANEAKLLQACLEIVLRPETAVASASFIQEGLAKTPASTPLLASAACLEGQRGNYSAACERWESLLKLLPDFTPAFRHLALLYFERLQDPRRAYPFALKAREAFRQDSAVAKVLGVLMYQRSSDYARAATLLAERMAAQPDDAEALYYLGMAHYQLKQRDLAKTELTKALELKLAPALSNECRKTLDGLK